MTNFCKSKSSYPRYVVKCICMHQQNHSAIGRYCCHIEKKMIMLMIFALVVLSLLICKALALQFICYNIDKCDIIGEDYINRI